LKTVDSLNRMADEDAGPNMKPTCIRIVTPENILVSCKLIEYVSIAIRIFYMFESIRILSCL
jgi:hypothetical protein